MRRGTSLYLDAVRFFAAFFVFIDHYADHQITGGLFYQLAPYGAEAVVVFFVLSGYVIAFATDTREHTVQAYLVNRAARIYSVALPALVATFLLDTIGLSINPELYLSLPEFQQHGQIWQFISGFLFVNQLWSMNTPIGSNLPYWSLGYEIWYYLLFGMALFGSKNWRFIGTIALLLIAGPRIAALFPLWLMGWATYRITSRCPPGKLFSHIFFTGAIIGWVGYEIFAHIHGRPFGLAPLFLHREQLVQDYIIGLLFSLSLLGVSAVAPLFERLSERLADTIRWTAGATFTLYLFHMPLLMFVGALLPWPRTSIALRLTLFVVPLLASFAIAELTERRKSAWRGWIASMLPQTIFGPKSIIASVSAMPNELTGSR